MYVPFVPRSFNETLEVFKASNPKKKLKSFDGVHPHGTAAYSFLNLKAWPSNPPLTALFHVGDVIDYSEGTLESADALLRFAGSGYTIGTWNSGGTGSWVKGGQDWALAVFDLTQEQAEDGESSGDFVDGIVAVWRLTKGWAAAVLRSGEKDLAVALIGLEAWPETGWQTERIWYGE